MCIYIHIYMCIYIYTHNYIFYGGQDEVLTADAPHDEDLLGAAVSHGPLSDLHQHGEHRLLQEEIHMVLENF